MSKKQGETDEQHCARVRAAQSGSRHGPGLYNGREYADYLGIPRGTVKRWLMEGLPCSRNLRSNSAIIDPVVADPWVHDHHGDSITFCRQSLIYLACRANDNAVKIGWTSDIERRMSELRRDVSGAVTLLLAVPGDKPDELRLHAQFAEHRLDGEWFGQCRALTDFLATFKQILAANDAPTKAVGADNNQTSSSSPNSLFSRAGEGARTLDVHLGKVV